MTQKLLTVTEVSEILDLKPARIYELTREKKLPFVKIGERQYQYSETALMNWIELTQPLAYIGGAAKQNASQRRGNVQKLNDERLEVKQDKSKEFPFCRFCDKSENHRQP